MKQNYLKSMLLMLMMCLGMSAWADINLTTEAVTLNSFSSFSGSGYKTVNNYTISSITGFSVTDCMLSNSNLQMKASTGVLTSPTITSAHGFTIEVEYTSDANMTVRTNAGDTKTAASKLTLTTESTSCTFTIATGNKYAIVSSITLTPRIPKEKHTATFSVNGNVDSYKSFEEGQSIVFPSVSDILDKKFIGWTKTVDYSDATTAPSDLCNAADMGDADVTYYAVFAIQKGSSNQEVTWNINGVTKTASGGSDVNTTLSTSSINPSSETGVWTAVAKNSYAGNSSSKAQLGSGSYKFAGTITLSNSAIPSEATISKINLTATSTATDANPYTVSASVNENTFGTEQSLSSGNANCQWTGTAKGNSIVLTTSCGYNKNIVISAISVTYSAATYSDYCTTVTAPVTYNVTIADDIENGTVTADPATAAEGETVTLTITPEDGFILAQLMVYTDYDDIEVVDNKFVMPAADVEVYAYFAPAPSTTYTLSELAEAGLDPYSIVSVSFDNEIVDIQMDEEEGGFIVLSDGDNTFALMTYYPCDPEWIVGGTLTGTWDNVYYAEQNGSFVLMNESDDPWADIEYTAPAPENGTLTFKATGDDKTYWATFSTDRGVLMPSVLDDDNTIISVYAVYAQNGELTLTDFIDDFGCKNGSNIFIPANTGVLVKAQPLDEEVTITKSLTYNYTNESYGEYEESFNLLKPASVAMTGDNKFYKLAKNSEGKLGFFYGATGGAAFSMTNNGAYLAVPSYLQIKSFTLDTIETAIKNVETKAENTMIFDLQGRKVSNAQKGLYIINGKKVVK